MPWVLCLREAESKKAVLVDSTMKIAADDARYEFEVHIVPCFEEKGMCVLKGHDLTRNCYCKPEVGPKVHGREMITHKETVN